MLMYYLYLVAKSGGKLFGGVTSASCLHEVPRPKTFALHMYVHELGHGHGHGRGNVMIEQRCCKRNPNPLSLEGQKRPDSRRHMRLLPAELASAALQQEEKRFGCRQ